MSRALLVLVFLVGMVGGGTAAGLEGERPPALGSSHLGGWSNWSVPERVDSGKSNTYALLGDESGPVCDSHLEVGRLGGGIRWADARASSALSPRPLPFSGEGARSVRGNGRRCTSGRRPGCGCLRDRRSGTWAPATGSPSGGAPTSSRRVFPNSPRAGEQARDGRTPSARAEADGPLRMAAQKDRRGKSHKKGRKKGRRRSKVAKPTPPPPPPEPPQPPASLVAARALVGTDPGASVVLLETVLEDPSAETFQPETSALIGQALQAVELPQLSLDHYLKSLRAGRLAPWFSDSFVNAARLSRLTHQDEGLARLMTSLEPADLPESERSYAAYLKGREAEAADEPSKAVTYLAGVPPEDENFVRARLVMANAFNKMRRRSLAVATLEDLQRTHSDLLQEDEQLRETVTLNLARAYYGAGRVEEARAIYEEFPRASGQWLKAQQELAWTHYRKFAVAEDLDALNRALGTLNSLNSPFFAEEYLPEPALLEIQILYQLCRSVEGGRRLDVFLPRYVAYRDALRDAIRDEGEDPEGVVESILEYRRSGERRSALPTVFLDQFRSRHSLDELEKHEEALDAELTTLQRFEDAWKAGAFARLAALLQKDRQQERIRLGEGIKQELELALRGLNGMLNQAQMARLDMVTAEKELYEAAAVGRLPKPPSVRSQKRWWKRMRLNREVWPFEGEYWADELGYYVGHAEPRCPE